MSSTTAGKVIDGLAEVKNGFPELALKNTSDDTSSYPFTRKWPSGSVCKPRCGPSSL